MLVIIRLRVMVSMMMNRMMLNIGLGRKILKVSVYKLIGNI